MLTKLVQTTESTTDTVISNSQTTPYPAALRHNAEDDELWEFFEDDPYEPRNTFAEEEEPPLDLDDF